jgi:hypothetical protein
MMAEREGERKKQREGGREGGEKEGEREIKGGMATGQGILPAIIRSKEEFSPRVLRRSTALPIL